MTPITVFADSPAPAFLWDSPSASAAILAQTHTHIIAAPSIIKPISIGLHGFPSPVVYFVRSHCAAKVESGRHERMMRFSVKGMSAMDMLFRAMFIVKLAAKHSTAMTSFVELSVLISISFSPILLKPSAFRGRYSSQKITNPPACCNPVTKNEAWKPIQAQESPASTQYSSGAGLRTVVDEKTAFMYMFMPVWAPKKMTRRPGVSNLGQVFIMHMIEPPTMQMADMPSSFNSLYSSPPPICVTWWLVT
mmetsp:Transcript_89095/g.251993  ORF Transcript_89095/g.251993 Transcript_89095/m.251993 type:complete len:249 (-) Transcript_89095:163-909(-)